MRKALVLTIIIVLAACGTPQAAEQAKTVTAPVPEPAVTEEVLPKAQPTPPPAPKTEPSPEQFIPQEPETPETPQSEATLDAEIQGILAKARTKTKSMTYNFVSPTDVGPGNIFHVKGNKIKIYLQRPLELRDMENYFDVVFLDTTQKTAKAYCMDVWEKNDCIELNRAFDASYAEYARPTPFDWIPKIENDARITGVEVYSNRDTTRIEFQKGKQVWAMLLDETYGVPIRVDIFEDDEMVQQYQYMNLVGNNVRSSDMEQPK